MYKLIHSKLTLFVILLFYTGLSQVLAQNPISTENALSGNPATEWQISGAGDLDIQGFATDISYNKGTRASFKIKTNPATAAYAIKIYRLGYYNGNGARFKGDATVVRAVAQPTCLTNATTGLVDCGNWSESAYWDIPSNAVSGIYLAKLTLTGGGSSHIAFIVRDDASTADLFFQTSDATWQAYNVYGDNNNGKSLYAGVNGGKASKVSYNRPFYTRAGGGGGGPEEDWLFNSEYPMIRFLEKNGYNISYTTNVDTERRGDLIKNHKVFLSVGHDEYWSKGMRDNVTAARNAGTHLAFFSGNEVYWKTRWETSIDNSGTAHRTLVCYKEGRLGENQCNGKCDTSTDEWTGLWRAGCEFPSSDGCNPENELTGQLSWDGTTGTIQVPSDYKNLRFWRNTSVASLNNGQTATLTPNTLGYEWNPEQEPYRSTYPAGRIILSRTIQNGKTHHLTLYKHTSGALVFGAGTVQWSWGLDNNHDRGNEPVSAAMQQATVNLFADMGVQPATLQSGLTAATASLDAQAPTLTITSPNGGANIPSGTALNITGTATDANTVAGVEVSTDGGTTWRLATGTTNWSFSWTPTTPGASSIRSRAFDDSGNISATTTVNVTVGSPGPQTCPCTVFQLTDVPTETLKNDGQPIQLGMKFRASNNGFVTGVRFYKQSGNSGTHIGQLYNSAGGILAQATFINETASGWQEVAFSPAVAITANTTYIISYHSSAGHYSIANPYFNVAKTNGPLKALADDEDGNNGVYKYSSAPTFPDNNYQSSNYFVDVVFTTESAPDNTPPTVFSTSPVNNANNVNEGANVSVTFNEAINPATVSTSTIRLLQGSSSVAGSVTYDAASRTATFNPTANLSYSTSYTVEVKGGTTDPRIKDEAGNALAANYNGTFTTRATSPPPPPSPNDGPGGPILVISATSNPFSRYAVEILRAEGLNEFAAKNITEVTSTVLESYDVVVLGDITVTSAQVTMLTNWVNAGGTLIAFKPDAPLASLLGLTPVSGSLTDKYLKVNTASGPGVGIVNETIQFHGPADLYTLNGATSLATLYSAANTATNNPAVTMRNVGTNGGKAIAFTYDLARSIVYTRQGNPAWAGQSRDNQSGPIRSDNLFFPDYVDFSKIAIPQADEQQRLLANIILQGNMHKKPLPRFWYLPRGLKAAVIMTGDDHGNGGTIGRFNDYLAKSSSNTQAAVDNWTAIRSTSYIYPNTPITDAQAAAFEAQGFEISLHLNTNCSDYSLSSLRSFFNEQLPALTAKLPSISPSATHRTHCIAWSDWASKPKVELENGIRLNTDYYYWPEAWINNRPGMFTGSGMPMRFADLDGSLLDVYQATTQLTDESGITYSTHINTLLDNALGAKGYYGVFTANMHTDQNGGNSSNGSDAIVSSAQQRQVPVISAKQMLTWLDGRNNSSFGAMTWNGNKLNFRITAGDGSNNLRAMLPIMADGGQLTGLTVNGSGVTYTTETVKGMLYAFFPANTGNYVATYDIDNTAPQITGVTVTQPNAGVATIKWNTNEPADSKIIYGTSANQLNTTEADATLSTAHTITLSGLAPGTTYYYRVTSTDAAGNSITTPNPPATPSSFKTPAADCFTDQTASSFNTGTAGSNTYVTADGVILKPEIAEEFTSLPPTSEWQNFPWSAGGASTLTNGQVVVDGARYNTEPENKTFGPGTSIDFIATFGAAPFQHIGFGAGDNAAMYNTIATWAMFSTGNTSNELKARVSNGGPSVDVTIPGNFLGTPHRYRIDWKTSSVEFYVDGTLVHTQNTALTAPMRVGVSDFNAGGPAVSLDWMRVSPYATTGSFTSRIYDGGKLKTWEEAIWKAELPTGTDVKLFQRQGNSPTPDETWTVFKAIIASGDVVGGTSRYIQYRADLSSSNAAITPVLQSVVIGCSEPNCPTVAFTPETGTALPTASVGLTYTQTISTNPSGYKFTATGLPTGLTINETSGVISGTPTASGNFNVTINLVKDACTTSANYTITVNPAITNRSPVLATIADKTVNVLEAITFTASATDADGDNLSFTLAGTVPTGATITAAGAFSWTPTRQQEGTHTFKIVVSDGKATDEEEFTITVNGVNQAPVLTAIGNKSVNELATLTFQASATDADVPANTLVYGLGQPETGNYPTGASLSTAGNFSWTPTEAQGPGTYRVKVVVTDGTATDEEEIQIQVNEVNQAPVLAAITNQTVAAQTKLEFTASAQDADLPVNTLTFSLVNAPTGASIDPTTGAFSWTPLENQAGTHTFTVRATDNGTSPLSADRQVTVTVTTTPISTYTLTVSAVNGTVVKNPNQASYTSGTNVTLTATPNAGYRFTGWSGDASGTTNPLTVNMNGNKSITANFAIMQGQQVVSYTLMNATTDQPIRDLVPGDVINLAAGNNLNIRVNTNPAVVGSVKMVLKLSNGTTVRNSTETAAPYAVYGDASGNYNNWTPALGNYSLTSTPYTAASGGGTAGTPLTLNFSVVNQPTTQYTLAVSATNGTVTKSPNQTSYASGTNVTLTATPNTGYQFTGWSGSATGTVNPLTVNMNGNKNITANFAPITATYTLTVSATNGTVSKNPNAASYANGTNVTLTATPNSGYQFTGWSGDATGTANPLTVTMNSNKNITATFVATSNAAPVLAAIGNKTVTVNQTLSFTATATDANAGQTKAFSLIGAPSGAVINASTGIFNWTPTTAGTFTFTVKVTDNGSPALSDEEQITVTVNNVSPTQYTLTVNSANGTVTKTPNQTTYAAGTNVSVAVVARAGYRFTGWSGAATGTANPVTIAMTSNKTLTANFAAVTGQQVVSYTLINATTDQPIRDIYPGEVINLAAGNILNIRVNTNPSTVGSVKMTLNSGSTLVKSITETAAPYALFGDVSGNYHNWTPAVGSYSLTATPYTAASGGGTAGTPLTMTFSVVNRATAALSRSAVSATTSELAELPMQATVYPTPTNNGKIRVSLSQPVEGEVRYTLVSVIGEKLKESKLTLTQPTTELDLDFVPQMQASGAYYLLLDHEKLQARLKLMKQ